MPVTYLLLVLEMFEKKKIHPHCKNALWKIIIWDQVNARRVKNNKNLYLKLKIMMCYYIILRVNFLNAGWVGWTISSYLKQKQEKDRDSSLSLVFLSLSLSFSLSLSLSLSLCSFLQKTKSFLKDK